METDGKIGRFSETLFSARLDHFENLPVIAEILNRLDCELAPTLYYHTGDHTRDVLAEALRFALIDGLDDHSQELLAVAAAYHDAGFLEQAEENEAIGAALAGAAMTRHGYSAADCAAVQQLILDTRICADSALPVQRASSELSIFLLDADLSNFGRADFFARGELQRRELGLNRASFLKQTRALMKRHDWLSPAGRLLRQEGKRSNLDHLEALIADVLAE